VDAVNASIGKALLLGMAGKRADAQYWIDNIENLGKLCINLGQASYREV
jgi:hypothetical protein